MSAVFNGYRRQGKSWFQAYRAAESLRKGESVGLARIVDGLEIDVCKCDFDVAVSAGPCQPPTDKLAESIRRLAP